MNVTIQLIYLISSILFILSLMWMNHPSTARRGVVAGVVAMLAAIGGTLFERMSQLARGNARHEDEDESERSRGEFEVPRFLNRQNNQ